MADLSITSTNVPTIKDLQHARLRIKIQTLLKRPENRNPDKKPQFSTQTMIIMALVMSDKPLDPAQIKAWILKEIRYYNHKAIDAFVNSTIIGSSLMTNGIDPVLPDFFEAFDCYDAPLLSADKDEVINSVSARTDSYLFKTSVTEARFFLREQLDFTATTRPLPTEPSKMLALPAELRKTIFEMVLAFPSPGVLFRENGYGVLRRACDQQNVRLDLGEDALPMNALDKALALFLVNRQVSDEAIEAFYAKNLLMFDSVYEFAQYAHRLSTEHLELVRNVSFQYSTISTGRNSAAYFKSGAKMLTKLTKLKRLEVQTVDGQWFDGYLSSSEWSTCCFSDPGELPGIHDLAFALNNAANFAVHGQCPRIRAFLHDQ